MHTSTEGQQVSPEQLGSTGPNGGDILVQVMRDAGVDVAFGVISIHNLPLVQAVDRELRFVPVRHEAAAVNAADGYARATGRIGVALTSTGTGAGNAAGSMLEALTAQSRVLHVTGNINAALIGEHRGAYHEVPRQLAMLQAVSQHAMRIETPRQARVALTEAVRLLDTAPHGPVSIDWPIDLQYTADPDAQNKVEDRSPTVRTGTQRDIERAVKLMATAKRPLIWAGGGARRVGEPLANLAEAWGAGVLTGTNGRGSVPEDHPLVVGNFAGDDAVAALVAEADCLLTIGSHLRPSETGNGSLPLPEAHVQVDLDEDALGRNFPIRVGIQADATVAVPALLDALGGSDTDGDWAQRVAGAAASARATLRETIGAYAPICDSLRKRLPRRAPIVRELGVLAAERPHVVLVVFNDGGYGVLRNMQAAAGDPTHAVDLATPDLKRLAGAYGLKHTRVGDPEGFDLALKKAVKKARPMLIEVDVNALEPAPADLVPPAEVP